VGDPSEVIAERRKSKPCSHGHRGVDGLGAPLFTGKPSWGSGYRRPRQDLVFHVKTRAAKVESPRNRAHGALCEYLAMKRRPGPVKRALGKPGPGARRSPDVKSDFADGDFGRVAS